VQFKGFSDELCILRTLHKGSADLITNLVEYKVLTS